MLKIKETAFYLWLSKVKWLLVLKGFKILRMFVPMKYLWSAFAQKGELEHHMRNKFRQSGDFMKHTEKLFSLVGYTRESFRNKVVVDLGSGSKLRSRYFEGSKIVAIDPLNKQFLENIQWSDLDKAYKMFSAPAEEFISEIENVADMVMCINVLDHTYDPEKILKNVYRYMKSNAEFFLSVDLNETIPNHKHPVPLPEKKLEEILHNNGFVIKLKKDYLIDGENLFGNGKGKAINYILLKG